MGDEEIRQLHLFLKIYQQVHDLSLHGDIQSRDCFIADDEFRIHCERTGKADSLALTAGEFMREAVGMLGMQADFFQQLIDHLHAFVIIFADVMDFQAFLDDLSDGEERVQRGIGVLVDHLHPSGQFSSFFSMNGSDVFSVKEDLSAIRFIEPDKGAADRGLSAARFANQS